MKVFLTGASGFLGQHIIKRLEKEGAHITALVRRTSSIDHLVSKNLTFVFGNIRDENVLKHCMKGVDIVIHAATSKGGKWENFYAENVESTKRLLELAKRNKIKRFVYISSVAVFDHSRVVDGTRFQEDSPYEETPMNHYSRSKIEAELQVKKFHKKGVPTVILRPACLYGPGGGDNKLYPSRLGFAAGSNAYLLLNGGKSTVPLSYVQSVAEAIWLSIQSDNAVGQQYNVVEDENISRYEYLESIQRIYKRQLKIKRMSLVFAKFLALCIRLAMRIVGMKAPTRLHPLYLKLFAVSVSYSNEKLKQDLGWKPLSDVMTSIDETMYWYAAQQKSHSAQVTPPKGEIVIKSPGQLTVAIAGCGEFSKTHLKSLEKIPNAKVLAVCDPNMAAAEEVANRFSIPNTYKSLSEVLKKISVDVVHVTSSAQTHAPLAIEAMKHGCHVIVEKPMSVDAKEAREMIRVAESNKVKLCPGHSLLFDSLAVEARRIVDSGTLGKLVQVESWFGTSYSSNPNSLYLAYEAKDHWAYQLPGSLYQNFLSHPLSIVLDLMGKVEDVHAFTTYNKIVPHMKNDELRLFLRNKSMMSTICLSFTATPRQSFVKIYGTSGTVYVDFMYKTLLLIQDVPLVPKVLSRNLTSLKQAKALRKSGHSNNIKLITGKFNLFESNERMLKLFYKSILDDTTVPVSLENGLQSMEVMDKVWQQIEV